MDSYKKSRRKSIIAWVIAFVLAIGAAIVSFTPLKIRKEFKSFIK